MTPCADRRAALFAALLACLAAPAAPAAVLTGEVRATDAQVLYVPFSNSSPGVIRYFVAEGDQVKKGAPVLRIDPGQAASQLPALYAQIRPGSRPASRTLAAWQ